MSSASTALAAERGLFFWPEEQQWRDETLSAPAGCFCPNYKEDQWLKP